MRATSRETSLPPGFGTIWVCVALDLVGFGIVLPILPLYAEEFGARAVSATALVAAFSAAQFVFSPIWGRLSDRVGRKPILVLSLAGTAVGSLVTGLAGSLTILFVGRVLDGISGASVSVAQASVADIAPPEQRARLLGLLGAAFGLGFVAGPAIGALGAVWNHRIPFFIAAALAAANAVVAWRRLPETHPSRRPPGIGRENGRADDQIPSQNEVGPSWRRRGVVELVLVAFMSLTAFSAFEATFALFADRRLDLELPSIGGLFAAVGLVLALVQWRLLGPVVQRLGEARTLRLGLLLNGVGLVLLAAVQSWPLLVPTLLCLIVGQGFVTPTLSSILAGRVRADRRGGMLGVQQAAGGLARVGGPVLGGVLFEHVGVPAPYIGGALLTGVAFALLFRDTLPPALRTER